MLSLVKGKAVEELGAKPVEVSRLKLGENVPARLDGTRRQTQRLVITIVPVCPSFGSIVQGCSTLLVSFIRPSGDPTPGNSYGAAGVGSAGRDASRRTKDQPLAKPSNSSAAHMRLPTDGRLRLFGPGQRRCGRLHTMLHIGALRAPATAPGSSGPRPGIQRWHTPAPAKR